MEPRADWAVAVIGRCVPPHLFDVACSYGAVLVLGADSQDALRRIEELQPRLVLVGVAGEVDDACALTAALARGHRRVTIVVAAVQHTEALERAVRAGGATYYVPDTGPETLGPLLDALRLAERSRHEPDEAGVPARNSGARDKRSTQPRTGLGPGESWR